MSLRSLATAGLLIVAATSLRAQTALYVEHDKEFCLVRRVAGSDPYIDDGKGRLVRVPGRNYALRNVPEYAPYYVAIRGLAVTSMGTRVLPTGSDLNPRMEIRAEFECAQTLNNVYVVLELNSEGGNNALLVQEVGRLMAREPKPIRIAGGLKFALGRGQYQIHIYSEGTELFHTEMPFTKVERTLDAMVQRRIAGVANADPQPFTGPAPEYPAELRRANARGEAVIGFKISATGRVLDPHVVQATDPAFGTAAVTAARMWRFLPRVKDGVARTSMAEMPFVFEPETKSERASR